MLRFDEVDVKQEALHSAMQGRSLQVANTDEMLASFRDDIVNMDVHNDDMQNKLQRLSQLGLWLPWAAGHPIRMATEVERSRARPRRHGARRAATGCLRRLRLLKNSRWKRAVATPLRWLPAARRGEEREQTTGAQSS